MTTRNKRLRFGLLALLGVALVLLIPIRPAEPTLLARATRALPLNGAQPYYWWLSEGEVMLLRDSGLVRYSIAKTSETPLTEVSRQFQQSDGKPDSIKVAPNGTRLLWTGGNGDTHVSLLDGRGHFKVRSFPVCEKRWLWDSKRWVEMIGLEGQFVFARVSYADRSKKPSEKPMFPPIPCTTDQINVPRMEMTDDAHVLAHYWNGRPGWITPARIIAVGFTASPMNVGKFQATPPREDYAWGELIFSPSIGNFAWAMDYQASRSLSGLFGASYTGFWVTTLGVTAPRALGAIATGRGDKPTNVQWTPSGDRLSFLYRGALWTVPVPPPENRAP